MNNFTDEEIMKELQHRIKLYNQAVIDLKQTNEELKAVNKKLKESEALKSHFVSNITNEIINPFTSILVLARNILSVKRENWEKVFSMVEHIHSETFNLDFQLKNIFAAAKIEAGEIYPEIMKVELKPIIEDVIDSFEIETKKRNIKIEFLFEIKSRSKEPYYCKTDPEKLKLMLSNLLYNAINFSREGGKIEVSAWKKNSGLFLKVKDYGEGISKENQKIIFDRFKKLDSGINSITRGHGLGLSINKAFLSMLNGEINITSQIGKGACFTIKLPEPEFETERLPDENEFLFDGTETIF